MRGEYPDPESRDHEAASRAFRAEIRAATPLGGAIVLSDARGRHFWGRCNRCNWYTRNSRDKAWAQDLADAHNEEHGL